MTGATPRVLVVQHELSTGPGWFGDWLAEEAVLLETTHPFAGDVVPDMTAYDAAVVLGGAMAPHDDSACPWLPDVRSRMADAVAAEVPVLGICLGAQLLALACGGHVRHGVRGPELGVLPVEVVPAAADDPVFSALGRTVPVVQWHWEEIEALPEGAVVLAGSGLYRHQIFRIGRRAWGVQGHPEVTAAIAADWAREDSPLLLAAGREPADLVDEVRAHEEDLVRTWRPVATAFAGIVRERSARRVAH